MKFVFELTACTRCGGSGHYSYCSMYGTTCFKCGGGKKQLTRRGAKARDAFNKKRAELCTVNVSALKVGDRIQYTSLGGKTTWKPVEKVEPSESYAISGTTGEKTRYISIELPEKSSLGFTGISWNVPENGTVLKYPTPEQWQALREHMGKYKGCTIVETAAKE